KLRFEPFAAVAAKPVRARAPGVVELAFDDAQGGGLVAFAFEPQVGAALVHGNFPGPALQVSAGKVAGDAGLLQQVGPVLPQQQVGCAGEPYHRSLRIQGGLIITSWEPAAACAAAGVHWGGTRAGGARCRHRSRTALPGSDDEKY